MLVTTAIVGENFKGPDGRGGRDALDEVDRQVELLAGADELLQAARTGRRQLLGRVVQDGDVVARRLAHPGILPPKSSPSEDKYKSRPVSCFDLQRQ